MHVWHVGHRIESQALHGYIDIDIIVKTNVEYVLSISTFGEAGM